MRQVWAPAGRWLRRNLLNVTLLLIGSSISLSVIGLVEIQSSRVAYCRAQNERHDRAVAFLDRYVAAYEKKHHLSAARLRAVSGQVQADLTLIQDLQPHLNCQKSTSNH